MSGIDVAPRITVAPGINIALTQITVNLNVLYICKGKKEKHSKKESIKKLINVTTFDKDIALGKNPNVYSGF